MEKDNELVSIIVPMRNAERYVSDALASILRERQTPIEVIVVNDRSTDASLDQVLRFSDDRIRVIEGPGRGVAAALNAGLAEARGAIIMRCDADDLYPETRIGHQVAWLRSNPGYAAVCGSFSTIDDDGHLVSDFDCGVEPLEITRELSGGKVRTSLCTFAIRAEAMVRVGGYREYFELASDIDFQLRLCEVGRIGFVPELFYFWRLHESSMTHRQSVLGDFFERTAHDFQKQRQTSGLDDLQREHPPIKPRAVPTRKNSARAHIQGTLLGRAWREHDAGQKGKALATGLRALTVNPSDIRVWKSVLALALRPTGSK